MSKYKLPKIEELLDAGVHFGHQVKRWHPDMEPYIYTARKNIHIIDLERTQELLEKAADFMYETAQKGGKIVFVGTKKQARDIVEIEGKRSGAMYVTERWLGGTITNLDVIKKNNIDKLLDMKSKKEKGEFSMYTKKERLLLDREIERLEKFVGGLTQLNRKPDALFVIDAKREKTAVKEAVRAGIPVVALIDTNTNPEGVSYIIPGNDDAIKSIAIVVKALGDAIEAGYEDYGKGEAARKAAEARETEKIIATTSKDVDVKKAVEKMEEKPIKETKTDDKKEEKVKAPKKEKKVEPKKEEKKEAPKKRGRPKKTDK